MNLGKNHFWSYFTDTFCEKHEHKVTSLLINVYNNAQMGLLLLR